MKSKAHDLGSCESAVALAALCLMLAAGLPALGASVSEKEADPLSWAAVAASGPVEARGEMLADWNDVSRGDVLAPRTDVRTGKRGRVTLTRNASLLIMDPNSRVELPDENVRELETSIVQNAGSVLYRVDRRAQPHFEVVTPYLVAGVKGTTFLVTVNDKYAAVTVEEGHVQVTDPATGKVTDLHAGDSVIHHNDHMEMEFVQDRRRSREAKKEVQRMDRMANNTTLIAAIKAQALGLQDPDGGASAGQAGIEIGEDVTLEVSEKNTTPDWRWMIDDSVLGGSPNPIGGNGVDPIKINPPGTVLPRGPANEVEDPQE